MPKVNVIVRLKKDHRAEIDQVAAGLKAQGMDVQEQLHILGRITGTVDESEVQNLQSVPGVAKVASERTFTTS